MVTFHLHVCPLLFAAPFLDTVLNTKEKVDYVMDRIPAGQYHLLQVLAKPHPQQALRLSWTCPTHPPTHKPCVPLVQAGWVWVRTWLVPPSSWLPTHQTTSAERVGGSGAVAAKAHAMQACPSGLTVDRPTCHCSCKQALVLLLQKKTLHIRKHSTVQQSQLPPFCCPAELIVDGGGTALPMLRQQDPKEYEVEEEVEGF